MKVFFYFLTIFGLFILILIFPAQTFLGAKDGLLLWFQTIMPTLLPYMILSNLLIRTNCAYYISRMLKPIFQKIFRISDYSCYAILIGFLCGYPMGAKVISDLVSNGHINKKEGQYLLSFCNNTSPIFIISFIVLETLHNSKLIFPTLLILYLSPICCSFLFRMIYKINPSDTNTQSKKAPLILDFSIWDYSIMNGFESITKVGGYIMLFSILFSIGNHFNLGLFLPVLEVANGIHWIAKLNLSFYNTYILILSLTSFGGICAVAQSYSMIQNSGLRIFPYIIQKLITAIVTSLFAMFFIYFILQ